MNEKLQKVLARAGLGSRREIEGWISAGLVKVNGHIASLGERVGERDQIQVRGRIIKTETLLTPPTQVLLYNKREDELVTRSDEKGRDTIFERLPKPNAGRWIAVGRLDVNTTGLLLLTNNGELANRLMHPSQQIERAYLVRVFGEVSQEILDRLLKGVPLDDGMANFDKLEPLKSFEPTDSMNRWYKVTLLEGRNREVRRLWESQGVRVSRLKRIAFGHITLPKSLRLGHAQLATTEQTNALLTSVGLPAMPVNEGQQRLKRPYNSQGLLPFARSNKTLDTVSRDENMRVQQGFSSQSILSERTRTEKFIDKSRRISANKSTFNVRSGQVKKQLTIGTKPPKRKTWRDNDDDYID